jgi:hypothetical protein
MRLFLDHLDHHTHLMHLMKLEFCRMAAAFADCKRHEQLGSPSAIAWISSNFQLTEVEAAMCIVIGRYLGASDARRATAIRRMP